MMPRPDFLTDASPRDTSVAAEDPSTLGFPVSAPSCTPVPNTCLFPLLIYKASSSSSSSSLLLFSARTALIDGGASDNGKSPLGESAVSDDDDQGLPADEDDPEFGEPSKSSGFLLPDEGSEAKEDVRMSLLSGLDGGVERCVGGGEGVPLGEVATFPLVEGSGDEVTIGGVPLLFLVSIGPAGIGPINTSSSPSPSPSPSP